MATTTLTAMRQALLNKIGGLITGTSTGAGTSTTLVDSVLGAYKDNAGEIVDRYLLLTSNTYSGQERKISGFTQSSGTVTTYAAFGGATGSGSTYEILPFPSATIKNAINFASQASFPWLHQLLTNETLWTVENQQSFELPSTFKGEPLQIWISRPLGTGITGNLFTDGDFDNWSGDTPSDWDITTQLTVTHETSSTRTKSSSSAAKCVATVSQTCYLEETIDNPGNYSGQKLNISIWVYCLTASRVKAIIEATNGSTSTTTAHAGGGWELLQIEHNVGNANASLKAGLIVSSGAAFTFIADSAILIQASYIAEPIWERVLNWRWDSSSRLLRFPYLLPNECQLRLIGMGLLSTVSAEADTVEVGEPEVQVIYTGALAYLYKTLRGRNPATSGEAFEKLVAQWEGEWERAKRKWGMPRIPGTMKIPNWRYRG